ncbi:MAG: DUF3857 domain-containing protein [Bacteroidales bacterium]|nr:DUF3857 domain-containing protein [Bacteroidales bacterium]
MMYKKIIFLVCFLLASTVNYSQKAPSKFGKISDQEMEAIVCPIDSNAHAYYVFDFGRTYFQYATTTVREGEMTGQQKGFQMHFERHYRIKIIDDNAFDWANIEIPLYHSDGDKEEVIQFKAATYNNSGKKIETVKLRFNDMISEEKNENWDVLKCALPQVKAGSVIEVSYTIKSDFLYNLQSWEFQHTIPTLFSEYHLSIPEYFHYNQSQRGYYRVDMETISKKNSFTISYLTSDMGLVSQGHNKSQQTIEYDENIFDYVATNIPAFPMEAYLTTAQNYISKVDFELAWTKFPNQSEHHYTTSWDKINHNLLTNSDFGMQLKRERFLKDEVEKLKLQNSDTLELIKNALSTIQKKFTWNGQTRKYTSGNLREVYKSGSGNSADINLSLVILLRELGIRAYPVLLSTRENGMIHPSHPSLSSFNYVIAVATDGENNYLMDATEPLSEINLLPTRCLNKDGWIVDEQRSGWINLQKSEAAKSATYDLVLSEDGGVQGTLNYTFNAYAALGERLKAARETDAESYLKLKFDNISGLLINKSDLTGIDSLYSNVNVNLDVNITEKMENAGNLFFFEPLFFDCMEENPFKIENREYPVEFEYPFTEMQSVSITIPENYTIEELPKPTIVKLDDGSAKFMYSISQFGNKVQITSVFSINKVFFLPEQYPFLKQLIDLVVDKHKEQIVLKKI